jgi:hypothetical protein
MFSGEIGSLQPQTSYAVARTIGSREMAQHSPGRRHQHPKFRGLGISLRSIRAAGFFRSAQPPLPP